MRYSIAVTLLGASALSLIGCGSTSRTGVGTAANTEDSGTNPCGIHSAYEGDDLCILPPDPEAGIQLHVGPTNYDDPDDVAPYLLAPSTENVLCYRTPISQSGFYYLKQQNRMRPSSHHMLIFVDGASAQDAGTGAQDGVLVPDGCDVATSVGSIPGSQTTSRDFPNQLGPEDQGLGRYLPQSTTADFQLHYINTTTEPVLREAWVNLYREDASAVTQHLQSIFMVGDLTVDIPAHTEATTTLDVAPTLASATRVFELNAHMHAHSQSMTVWLEHAGAEQIIYQSFNWEDPYENTFNTVVTNPTPDPKSNRDGGISGLLYLQPGDSLRWACDVNNTLDTTIHFANDALTAEMCMIIGSYISPTPGLLAGFCANGACQTGLGAQSK